MSSKLLRCYSCGQIDIAYVHNKKIVLVEAKSSSIGLAAMRKGQGRRVWRSALLLQSLIGMPVVVKFIAKRFSAI